MDIIVKRRGPGSPPAQPKAAQPSRSERRIGEWGTVEALHSADNTVDVLLGSGVFLNRIPAASREWVISGDDAGKDYTAGERSLPPVHARVFVIMPAGTYNDCFVAPFSGFSTIDQTKPFMEEDKENIRERITPSGWRITDDCVTGSRTIKNSAQDGETIKIEIDQTEKGNEKVIITIHGNRIAFHKDTGIRIETEQAVYLKTGGNTVIESDEEIIVNSVKNLTIKSGVKTMIKGAQVETGGTVAPSGQGPYCALPYCLATGAPHAGTLIQGAL